MFRQIVRILPVLLVGIALVQPEAHAQNSKPKSNKKSKTNASAAPQWDASEISIPSSRVEGSIDVRNVESNVWDAATQVAVPVTNQNMVAPMLTEPSVDTMYVKSIHDSSWVAFRLQWADETKDVTIDSDVFCDQVAVQLPVGKVDLPSPMMGHTSTPVHIVHWKGVWQADCETGFRDIVDAYPNIWVDYYPTRESDLDRTVRVFAKDVPAEMIAVQSPNILPGTAAHNPVSSIKRKQPVEEARAEGYGTYTTSERQLAVGWGSWKNGMWTVCIVIPINNQDAMRPTIEGRTKVGFAVWNGKQQNVGSRKHWAQWSDLILQP